MIVHKVFYKDVHQHGYYVGRRRIEGWYLFGIIPLFIKTIDEF